MIKGTENVFIPKTFPNLYEIIPEVFRYVNAQDSVFD